MRSLLAAILLAPLAAASQTCSDETGAGPLESKRYLVALRTVPEKIVVGQHFSVDLTVCPRAGATQPESVSVDAHMPEHRHGMNYKTSVRHGPDGHYMASGLMFHMPGRWEFMIDVRSAGSTERLTRSVLVE